MDRKLVMQILRGLFVVVTVVLLIAGLVYAIPLVYPFLIGLIIAYLLNPAITFLHARARLPRWLSALLCVAVFFAACTLVIYFVIDRLLSELNGMIHTINTHLQDWINRFIAYVQSDLPRNVIGQLNDFLRANNYQVTVDQSIGSLGNRLSETISNLLQDLTGLIIDFITALPTIAIVTIVIILASFLIGKDWYKLRERIAEWIPEAIKRPGRSIWTDLEKALFGYLRAQLVLISLTAVLVIIGLSVIGVPHALTIGLLIGLVDLMPYLGTGAAMVPWIAYSFVAGDIRLGVSLSVLYGVILVARQFVEPKVLASSIGLNSLATLIAMFAGLRLFGALGLIFGPATLVILLAFHRAGVLRELKQYVVFGRGEQHR